MQLNGKCQKCHALATANATLTLILAFHDADFIQWRLDGVVLPPIRTIDLPEN